MKKQLYPLFRRNSYTITVVLVLTAMTYFVISEGVTASGIIFLIGQVGFFAALWYILRPGRAASAEADEIIKSIGNGRPTFVNVYSDY